MKKTTFKCWQVMLIEHLLKSGVAFPNQEFRKEYNSIVLLWPVPVDLVYIWYHHMFPSVVTVAIPEFCFRDSADLNSTIIIAYTVEHLLYPRHPSRNFTYLQKSLWHVLLLFSFYKWWNWWTKDKQLVNKWQSSNLNLGRLAPSCSIASWISSCSIGNKQSKQ